MESNEILSKLNRARRALDALSQVEIIDEWEFDKELNIWHLHLGITIDYETKYFPQISKWYIVAASDYPKGSIKVYPDIRDSITVTLYHQANNSEVERNGLWRKGALCLEVNTLSSFQPEPYNADERLIYHVKRAINWLELAARGQLVTDTELFELPEFTLRNAFGMQFAFSEDTVTFTQWESTDCRYGIAELDVYKRNPSVYYVKCFKSITGNIEHYTQWGKYLSQTSISTPINAPWMLLKQIPVIHEWQAPETMGDLIDACNRQHTDIMNVLKNVVSKIRDGRRHLLLLGFPVPKTFGDKTEVLARKTKVDWIISENWNQQEISQRGKMNDFMLRKKILLIGAGCVGASVAEILVRSGVYNLTVIDSDIFEVGNLSRHVLNINNIGEGKGLSLCNYLNSLNPHANIEAINNALTIDGKLKTNIDLDKYGVIIDCTGENSVLDIIQSCDFKKRHIFASVSVGLGAKRLYITLMNNQTFNFNAFFDLIAPYLQSEKALYNDYNLPRNGIGCWHPTFPGRSDDVWLAASTAIKAIENYIITKSEKTISLVYEQRESNSIFEGYMLVDKAEEG